MATVDVVHHVAGGAGEAGQADQGVGEREAGAGVAAAGERRSDQGDQELFILSQKKSAVQSRCWRMRTWLL